MGGAKRNPGSETPRGRSPASARGAGKPACRREFSPGARPTQDQAPQSNTGGIFRDLLGPVHSVGAPTVREGLAASTRFIRQRPRSPLWLRLVRVSTCIMKFAPNVAENSGARFRAPTAREGSKPPPRAESSGAHSSAIGFCPVFVGCRPFPGSFFGRVFRVLRPSGGEKRGLWLTL